MRFYPLLLCAMLATALRAQPGPSAEPPRTWIDPDTGHRVVRLTDEPGSASLYFNQNAYTADGKKMVYTTPGGISVLNLETRASKPLVAGRVRVIVTGRKSQNVYYTKGDAVFSADIDTGATREIAKLPPRGSVSTVNADETLLAGTYTEQDAPAVNVTQRDAPQQLDQAPYKGQMMEQRLAARIPMGLFLIDVKTGAAKTIHKSTDWLNHLEFSPTDPTLLMFCHEGPWHKVDRIWTININTKQVKLMHKRTMDMEIAGHEWFEPDGKIIWFDLQQPRSTTFFVSGTNVQTGAEKKYSLTRDEWSIHFTISPDEKLFAGDGGDPGQVAKAKNGEWIYLFTPTGDSMKAERLVDMKNHNYKLEPNVHFSPDQKWIIFRANFEGHTDVYAVEIKNNNQAGKNVQ